LPVDTDAPDYDPSKVKPINIDTNKFWVFTSYKI
jgi:hypothetical protein